LDDEAVLVAIVEAQRQREQFLQLVQEDEGLQENGESLGNLLFD
jgi:hypothetical protein